MSWHEEYLVSLQKRNDLELQTKVVYDHYSKLAKRVVALEADTGQQTIAGREAVQKSASPSRKDAQRLLAGQTSSNLDLAEAQKARARLETQLKETRQELETLSTTSASEKLRIRELTVENTIFGKKLRDRDEELREKAKLLDNVHDEMLALTMQLNVTEEHNQKLKKENQDLVDRWMARIGQEADAMNNASKFS